MVFIQHIILSKELENYAPKFWLERRRDDSLILGLHWYELHVTKKLESITLQDLVVRHNDVQEFMRKAVADMVIKAAEYIVENKEKWE